ncbi:MAG: autotransporter outer membrane beta-barrel domain-containing protein [Devosiaceae bacterium]|nr:autotransporter outer membrane beta-barrel domain-containing protein [Devosiaceae bacterium]
MYAFNAGVVFGGEISDPNLGLFGVSAGYSGSKFSTITAGATSKADNFQVGVYGMWGSAATAEAGWGLSGALDYTYSMYETRRPINVGGLDLTAAADYGGYSIGGEFKARYGFESEIFGSNSIISPFAGVNFLNSKNNAFSETGAGALNISATEADSNRIASLLGFEISSQAIIGETPVNSRISVGWQHEFGDVNQINSFRLQGSPTHFLVSSPKEARDKLVLSAGLDFATSNNAMLTLSANGEASATSLAYGGSISYKLQF